MHETNFSRKPRGEKPVTVVIIDDSAEFLSTISNFFEENLAQEISIVGQAKGAASAIKQVSEKKPKVVLLDLKMPDMHGFDVIPRLKKIDKQLLIVVTTLLPVEYDEQTVVIYTESAKIAGADGFIPKDKLTTGLVEMLEQL